MGKKRCCPNSNFSSSIPFNFLESSAMDSDVSSDVNCSGNETQSNSKKREKTGRMADVMKKLRAISHEPGENCNCKRFRCFEIVGEADRKHILKKFNELGDHNAQSKYLSGLITVLPVRRRRSRKNAIESKVKFASYSYRVGTGFDSSPQSVQVCLKAFISIHGITSGRVQHLRESITSPDQVPITELPIDGRGRHQNRPRKLSAETHSRIINYIKSLKGGKSHLSLLDSSDIYLPESLNIAKLHKMYVDENPAHKVSYETFRTICIDIRLD